MASKPRFDSRVLNKIRKTQKYIVSKLLSLRVVYMFVIFCDEVHGLRLLGRSNLGAVSGCSGCSGRSGPT